MIRLVAILSMALLFSCAHSVHQVDVSQPLKMGPIKGKRIEVTSEQFVIMGFVTQTDYVNQAHNALVAKCPQGNIDRVTTRYSTSLGFFSWTNKIKMMGYCTK